MVYNPPAMHKPGRHIHRPKTPLGAGWSYDRRPLYAVRRRARRWLLWAGLAGLAAAALYEGVLPLLSALSAWLIA